jgi:hypothetical protein
MENEKSPELKNDGYLIDPEGRKSSKRLAGFVGLAGLIFVAVFTVMKDPTQAEAVMQPISWVVMVCFGSAAVDHFSTKKVRPV